METQVLKVKGTPEQIAAVQGYIHLLNRHVEAKVTADVVSVEELMATARGLVLGDRQVQDVLERHER